MKIVFSIMSNLQILYHLELDFQRVDQHPDTWVYFHLICEVWWMVKGLVNNLL